ncbi:MULTISPECIES: plasmid replication protein RepC [Sinorhizobium]|uniref:Replication initiation protein RepC n=2 Tax=Sinorhizobium TaxID=28105 RepID=A0A2S3YVA2_9HYPH|nr:MULTISPECIES: plasmid replication protein RepC [Sinorhizobium]AUX80723.1 replication initiation protein RepC 3 [Sinorhizobium fredii]PDT39628.1 replication initiation protein RepC [Sinorhizobium sp. FG01]POH35553.1 replication initiation protein RepC [Sinorhizobium americanum]
MERGNVTTPFGRRAMTLGMLARQIAAGDIPPKQSVDKWKLFRTVCEAKAEIGISDRSLAVLNALLSFSPGAELSSENGLVVFPSNAQLSLRAHGMAGTTLRRHLACLVEAGLIVRRDSPNGKRYARKNRNGAIGEAFGFDLAPLLARAEEFKAAAAKLAAEQQHLRLVRERLSLCRRDITKLLELSREIGPDADLDALESEIQHLITGLPRKAPAGVVEAILEKLAKLRDDLTNRLEILLNSQKTAANDHQNGWHKQNSDPDSQFESEPGMGKGREISFTADARRTESDGRTRKPEQRRRDEASPRLPASLVPPTAPVERLSRQIPLPAVLQACPQIADYAPSGRVANWKDLITAAIVVRTMLEVSADAYEDACSVLGYENAATVMACILERADRINSPGGYLRDLTRRARQQTFSLAPMIGALSQASRASATMAS